MKRKIAPNTVMFPDYPIDDNQLFHWQIWIVKTSAKTGFATKINLWYSWILPASMNKEGWLKQTQEYQTLLTNEEGKNIRIELLMAAYYGQASTITGMINALKQGKTLSEASADNDAGNIPTDFINLSLGPNDTDIQALYATRPEVLLPIEHMLIPWASKAIPNPSDYGCFVTQMVRLDKTDLLHFNSYKLSHSDTNSAIAGVAASFKSQTGFDFTRSSAPRLGNMEWYRFPVSNKRHEPLVNFACYRETDMPSHRVDVWLQALAGAQVKNVLVGCRITNGEEIVLDQLQPLTWYDQPITLNFSTTQPVGEIRVTVWEQVDDTDKWNIIFEESKICIREMNFVMAVTGSNINAGRVNLLNKLSTKKEESKPVELAQYSRSSQASTSTIGGYSTDPWVIAARSAIKWAARNFPQVSGQKFFLNGWDATKEATGQVSFVEWMFETISGKKPGGLILIDPFFDPDGVELFSHARTSNTQYKVLTCTQHREKDAVPNAAVQTLTTVQPSHSDRLKNACASREPLLRGLDFSLLELKSPAGGKEQLFHDRYLIITDVAGFPIKGYHLSNSIQGATRHAPILITTIAEDVLPEVVNYLQDLLTPSPVTKGKKAEIVVLYDTKQKNESLKKSRPVAENYIQEIPNRGFFFSKLLDNAALEYAEDNEIEQHLVQKGLFKENSFLVYNLNPGQLKGFAAELASATQPHFNKLMDALGEMFAKGHSFNHDVNENKKETYDARRELEASVKNYPDIADKIFTYLDGYKNSEKLINDRNRLFGMFRKDSFEGSFKSASSTISYMGGDLFVMTYGLMNATKLLVKCFPDKACSLLEMLIHQAEAEGWNEADSYVRSRLLLISGITNHFLGYFNRMDTGLQEPFLRSANTQIRAASSAGLIRSILPHEQIGEPNKPEIWQLLERSLPDEEYRICVSMFINTLHLRQSDNVTADLKNEAHIKLLDNFKGTPDLIDRIVRVLGGRLPYNHAYEIHFRFLLPLVDKGIIATVDAADIWNKVLINKVRKREEYIDRGSDSHIDNFCVSTDIELTKALIASFKDLTSEQQLVRLNQWTDAIKEIWPIVRRPFGENAYNHYYESAQRVYWVTTIISKLLDNDFFKDDVRSRAINHLQANEEEIALVSEFMVRVRNEHIIQLQSIS